MGREDPRGFLRWPMIAKAMFVSNQPYLWIELLSLRSRRDWRPRWQPALRESPVGHPVPFWALPWSSGNLIHHAYHLAQFEARTGRPAERFPAVFEFGGGYGSMCRLFHQLGFSGRYVIYDLPQFSALQAFYLGSLGLPLVDADRLAGADRGVACVSDPATLVQALAWADASCTLSVATWSLSETPAHVRDTIMPLVAECAGVLIAYWRTFGEMNNHEYFSRWAAGHAEFTWSIAPSSACPSTSTSSEHAAGGPTVRSRSRPPHAVLRDGPRGRSTGHGTERSAACSNGTACAAYVPRPRAPATRSSRGAAHACACAWHGPVATMTGAARPLRPRRRGRRWSGSTSTRGQALTLAAIAAHIVLSRAAVLLNTPNIAFVGYRLHFWLSGGTALRRRPPTSGSLTSACRGRTSFSRREA